MPSPTNYGQIRTCTSSFSPNHYIIFDYVVISCLRNPPKSSWRVSCHPVYSYASEKNVEKGSLYSLFQNVERGRNENHPESTARLHGFKVLRR
jgi:hypothetical protein